MKIDIDLIRKLFDDYDFAKGYEYYIKGRVARLSAFEYDKSKVYVMCNVFGSKEYDVSLDLSETGGREDLLMRCSCPRFAEYCKCKHVAAAMLEYVIRHCSDEEKANRYRKIAEQYYEDVTKNKPPETSPQAKNLVNVYANRALSGLGTGKARVMPRLNPIPFRRSFPELQISVGVNRLYIVRNIKGFLQNVIERKTVTYGKNLTLCHGIENFDELSRAMLELLIDESAEFYSTDPEFTSYYKVGDICGLRDGLASDAIALNAPLFDRLFDIFIKIPDGIRDSDGGFLTVEEGNPQISVSLTTQDDVVHVSVKKPENTRIFGGSKHSYTMDIFTLKRCSAEFTRWVYPLLREMDREMTILPEDMPTFCSYVLSKLRGLVTLDDPEGLMEKYLPDECAARFYFDLDADSAKLSLEVRFLYGEAEISAADTEKGGDYKRNALAEDEILTFAGLFLGNEPQKGKFSLSGDDAVYGFLSSEMNAFFERGEVFVSDRLRRKRVQPSPAAVGVSVSDGSLLLDIDTGEFPAEELEELYQSLLMRRRYHRLRDGRYLALDGSSYETLAEMTHMLRLSDEDLRRGHVQLPAYRALYIDGLLSEREDVRVNRDSAFRAMVRNFKSFAESDYCTPENLDQVLRPYQKSGFQWMKTLESCGFGGILADEMGLGKTLQAIAFFATASRSVTGKPSLVVCPASLILNWMDELEKFAPKLKAVAAMGTWGERTALLSDIGDADIIVTSYELLRQDIKRYETIDFYCCVLDEGQHIKNSSTQVSKAVKLLHCQQRFILTGTPIENRLSELWNLFDFLMPGYLYSNNTFVEKLEKPAIKSEDAEALAQLRRLVRPFMLRRLKKDVLRELPPVIEHLHRIAMSEQERKTYLATAAQVKKKLDTDSDKLQVLAALTRLRQICCDPGLCSKNYTGPSGKLEACLDLCADMAENGHQILLFSQFTSMLDRIRPRLDALGITSFTLQGSTPKEQRAELVRRFNAGEAQVFLISLKAGGTGLNLTAADVVIHYDPWWNLAAQDQATGRAHRMGQNSVVQVYKLIAMNTIEEKILTLQGNKASLLTSIASEAEGGTLSMTKEDLLALLD